MRKHVERSICFVSCARARADLCPVMAATPDTIREVLRKCCIRYEVRVIKSTKKLGKYKYQPLDLIIVTQCPMYQQGRFARTGTR